MHNTIKRNRHLWLLSGTGEGPNLANLLVGDGWRVTVSVVSKKASEAYSGISLDQLWVGAIGGTVGILKILNKAKKEHDGFHCLIDATHPFATLISSDLQKVCSEIGQKMIRYERTFEEINGATIIKDVNDLAGLDLRDKRFLMALGSRHLSKASCIAQNSGASVFARILPTPVSFQNALKSLIPEYQIALLTPKKGNIFGAYESALCRKWEITDVLCRQSGGISEQIWHSVCKKEKINLWLISRPFIGKSFDCVNEFDQMISKLNMF